MPLLPWVYPLGISAAAFLPLLPPRSIVAGTAVIALAAALLRPRLRLLAWLLLGLCHGTWWGHQQLAHQLPLALDKTDFKVVGVVTSLPQSDDAKTRFRLAVEELSGGGQAAPPLETLLLGWYGGVDRSPQLGERWQLQVRLRSPRGFANPGGFDYRSWLLGEGISATGYVRAGSFNQRLADDAGGWFATLRRTLAERLGNRDYTAAASGYMAALVFGDTSGIPSSGWDRLVATGTVHLMVVSGLHVGMVAGGCFFLGLCLGRVAAALGATLPAPQLGGACAVAGALGYGLLAGGGLPLVRSILMTLVVTLAVISRRRIGTWQSFGMALCGVVILDPLALLRQGFWLSFGAVAALLLWFVPRPGIGRWRRLWDAQLAVFIALLAALLFFQGAVYWTSPLVNLLAIPWVSLAIVPLCLLGAVCQWLPVLGDPLWDLAAWQLDWLSAGLAWASGPGDSVAWQPANARQPWFTAGLLVLALMAMLPAALGLRGLAGLLLAGLLLGRSPPGPAFELTVLDVGQGLAAVIRAGDHTLVYDAGPRFSEAFNAGSGIVLPYLRSRGIESVDLLVISHGDNDHAGGAGDVRAGMAVAEVVGGRDTLEAHRGAAACHRGQRWFWGDVELTMLSPPMAAGDIYRRSNNGSCVLLVRFGAVTVLLPGDIEREVEYRLAGQPLDGGESGVDVVVAPHHGSKTSSTTAFIRWAKPRHVVFAAGFGHHFGHPHPQVVSRYQEAGSTLWNTADSGALVFRWDGGGEPAISEYRLRPGRSWRER
ncbi:MAG: DNA internalization-related competence protein ComEC/Rec2 [Porticoccaceae bacterium]